MTDGDALLRAIAAAPDDDAPRLVYADWLDEHDRPDPAELIRIQCELARPEGTRGRRTRLRFRERDLLKVAELEWKKGIGKNCKGVEFRRGFVEYIAAPSVVLAANGPAIFGPGLVGEVRVVETSIPPPVVQNLAALAGVRTVHLDCVNLRNAQLPALAAADRLRGLAVLDLRWNSLTATAVNMLVEREPFTSAEKILLGGNSFSPDACDRLAAALGARVSFDVGRPADFLYPLLPTGGWLTGLDADDRQVILINVEPHAFRLVAFFFDLDGDLLAVEEPSVRTREVSPGPLIDDGRVKGYAAHLGLVPGPIRVKRFAHADSGVRIHDYTAEQLAQNAVGPSPVADLAAASLFAGVHRWHPAGYFDFPGFPT